MFELITLFVTVRVLEEDGLLTAPPPFTAAPPPSWSRTSFSVTAVAPAVVSIRWNESLPETMVFPAPLPPPLPSIVVGAWIESVANRVWVPLTPKVIVSGPGVALTPRSRP